ncbi:hypothetical protein IQ06DRAFT_346023 [Phaeosphaeriaceae sp. SRC1lsM3a]|nr:hypothetical protein IQ06DRAFT_346023 [Stagonospora sp. SRC1lsM3a]
MKTSVTVVALLSAVTALPTAVVGAAAEGQGAIIFTEPERKGDSAMIPGNAWCTDLSNIFGNFNGRVRSMVVEKGFPNFINKGCPADGDKYEFGSKDLTLAVGKLPEWLDQKIHSVYCV